MFKGSPMVVTEIYKLPQLDTGRYERHEFLMANGNATLTVHVAEISPVTIQFDRTSSAGQRTLIGSIPGLKIPVQNILINNRSRACPASAGMRRQPAETV